MRRSAPSRPRWLVLGALLVLGLLSAGPAPRLAAASPTAPANYAAVAGAPEAVPAPQMATVRFGSPQAISDAGVFIGKARGYFRELGLDVDTVPFQSGPDTIPALAAGEIESAGGTISIALLNAVERGVELRMVADKGTSRAGFEYNQVAVRSDLMGGAVRDLTDLRGRKIAVASLRSGAESLVAHVLARGGVSVAEVDLVPLGFPEMVVALGNRAIDAANMTEPALSTAVERGLATTWEAGYSGPAFGGVYQAATMLYPARFAAQTDVARRFMLGYLRGVRAYNDAFVKGEGRADVVRILIENTAVKEPAAYERMQMAGLDPDGRIARPSLALDMDYFRQQGHYTGPITLDALIDTSFADYAAQQLGPYR
jgi:NitT/TauT family transport system substrate-binding protein